MIFMIRNFRALVVFQRWKTGKQTHNCKQGAEVGDDSKDETLANSNICNKSRCCLTQNNYCHVSMGLFLYIMPVAVIDSDPSIVACLIYYVFG